MENRSYCLTPGFLYLFQRVFKESYIGNFLSALLILNSSTQHLWGLRICLKASLQLFVSNWYQPQRKGEELAHGGGANSSLGNQLFLSPRVLTVQLLNYSPSFGKPFKAQETFELHRACGWLWFPWHCLSCCYFREKTFQNLLTLLLCWQFTKCLKRKEKEIYLNRRRLIVHSELAFFGHGHLTTYIEILHISCFGIGITYLSVQDPFAVVPASDAKADCQQEYCLRWHCRHTTFGWLDGVAQFCHIPCSFVSAQCLCVERPGILGRIGKAVCSANFMV